MLKSLFTFLGFTKTGEINTSYPDNFSFPDNLDLKLQYLKDLNEQENERQNTIDTKTSQLIGQTGIIFSLVSLFIPTYIDKFQDIATSYKVLCIIVFVGTLAFYLLCILHATKYLNVSKYKYGQRSTATVKRKFNTEADFKIEEIKDLIFCIERNTELNTLKAGNLIYAHRSFRIGNLSIGMLSLLLLFSFYSLKPKEPNKMTLEGPVSIKGLDSLVQVKESTRTQSKIIIQVGDSVKILHAK
ncbi:MAG TPA: hypothetical protein VF622_13245 [Segetibacter sp.]|jgi:hypothetical protein